MSSAYRSHAGLQTGRTGIVIHAEMIVDLVLEQMPVSLILHAANAENVMPELINCPSTKGKTDINKGSLLACVDRLLLIANFLA